MKPAPKVTVAVPTFNRVALLREALASILRQDYPNFEVVVFDNASTDGTPAVLEEFRDPRLRLDRSGNNLGMIGNWNRCIERNRSPYLCIFHDDDLMLPGFLSRCMAELEATPKAGFAYCLAEIVDLHGVHRSMQPADEVIRDGVVSGLDFLEAMLAGRGGTIYPSSVMFRGSALKEVGTFDSPHSRINIDRNYYYRLASRFDVLVIEEHLITAREHAGQYSETALRSAASPGAIGSLAERLDVGVYLLESQRAAKPEYRRWLADRMLKLHARESDLLHSVLPGSYWGWQELVERAQNELHEVLPVTASFLFVGEDSWGIGSGFRGRGVVPFPERNGMFWGQPANSAEAVEELKRQHRLGAEFLVFPWTTFWWTDFYSGLDAYLTRHAERILWNPRLMVYRLKRSDLHRVKVRKASGTLRRTRTSRSARLDKRSTRARPADSRSR